VSVETLNHAALAVSRLTGLYQDKPKWRVLVTTLAGAFDDMEPVLQVIAQLDDVDAKDATGAYIVGGLNLDILGKRIGQTRRISNVIPRLYFGWDDDALALGWGEDDGERAGGSWYEDGQPLYDDTLMDDATYRVLIRLRRLKNGAPLVDSAAPTGAQLINFETLIKAFLFVFPDATALGTYALVLTEVTATVIFGLGRQPTQLELAMLRYSGAFPKPAGVLLSCYWWPYGTPTFAFDDDLDPNAAGWGEDEDPPAGGVFAEEF
jgi:hypothetical protein